MIEWPVIAKNFVPDGSLCDICVLGTDLEDWERALAHLAEHSTSHRYSVDGREESRFPSAEAALALRSHASPSLSVAMGGITLACHFFEVNDIEFDFLPAEVDGQERLDALLEVVKSLGRVTGKQVIVSPEGAPAMAFLRYDPLKRIVEQLHA